MSIRRRRWTTAGGERKSAWVVDYVDGEGTRRLKTFNRKKDADAFHSTAKVEVREGKHVPESATIPVSEAAQLWIDSGRSAGLETTTIDQRQQHVDLHIVPLIGRLKLSRLTVPAVRAFQDRLREKGCSPAMVTRVLVSLGGILADAQDRGHVSHNAVRELSRRRKGGNGQRRKQKMQVGVDIPTRDEIKAMIGAAKGRWRPFLITAALTGLRASELRGLRWVDVDLQKAELHVRQRADAYNEIGPPKSEAGQRTVPLPPIVVSSLREWKLRCPKKDGQLAYVFPNGTGNIEGTANIVKRGLQPTLVAAGVTKPVLDQHGVPARDKEGKPVLAPKYTGLHALRHFFASWLINRREDGGLGLPAKMVQERLGHASIVMTLDTYGHLFKSGDAHKELAEAERALLGA